MEWLKRNEVLAILQMVMMVLITVIGFFLIRTYKEIDSKVSTEVYQANKELVNEKLKSVKKVQEMQALYSSEAVKEMKADISSMDEKLDKIYPMLIEMKK